MIQNIFNSFAAIDYVGEGIAAFLGITTPKYQYVIDELIQEQQQVTWPQVIVFPL